MDNGIDIRDADPSPLREEPVAHHTRAVDERPAPRHPTRTRLLARLAEFADTLARRPERLLIVFAVYYLAQIGVRLLIPHGLRIDEAQQVFLAQWLLPGYDAQPPLYNWLQYAVFAVTGDYLLGLAALKGIVLFAVMASYYALGCMVLRDRAFAALGCLALFLTPQVFWQAQRDLTHTTAMMLLVNLLMIATVHTIRRPNLTAYLFLGAAIGFGMLTKYNFAILVAALFLAVLLLPVGRQRLFDRRIMLTAAVALAILTPHLLWLFNHLDVASSVTAERMAENAEKISRGVEILSGTASLLINTAVIAAPGLVLLLAGFGRPLLRALRARNAWSDFFLVLLGAVLLLLVLVVLALTFTNFRDRWLLPLMQMVPLLLCLKLKAADLDGRAALRRVLPAALIIMTLIVPTTYGVGRFNTNADYVEPFDAFGEAFRRQTGIKTAGLIVTVNWQTAGNLKMEFPGSSVIATDFSHLRLPFTWRAEHPILLVWRGSETVPEDLQEWLAKEKGLDASRLSVETFLAPYTGFRDRLAEAFRYVIVRPEAQ